MSKQSDYLWDQIRNHCFLFFSSEANEALDGTRIIFTTYGNASQLREPAIAIPIDIRSPRNPNGPYTVEFNGAVVTLRNRLPRPEGKGWTSLPNPVKPLWYRHDSGTLIPAWNLFGNLFDLLTLQEELESSDRDKHGRFVAAYSPRVKDNLLEVPAFNEAAAVLVDAALSLRRGGLPSLNLGSHINAPVVVLSHDCDILLGSDFWTQSIRAYRIFQPLLRARLPRLQNAWWMLRNFIFPRDFYFDNVIGMINMERIFGYKSAFYLLNGTGGRFGSRSGSKIISELVDVIPDGWEVGIHYNYDTFLNAKRFAEQKGELEKITLGRIVTGRAHYLMLDPGRSFSFFVEHGIRVDESVGYPDRIGYRCGIGGCFQPYDAVTEKALDVYEVPMVFMEGTLLRQYGRDPISVFERMLRHLKCVGGALSLLVHPGLFFNPEFPEVMGFYHKTLMKCRELGAVSETSDSLMRRASAMM